MKNVQQSAINPSGANLLKVNDDQVINGEFIEDNLTKIGRAELNRLVTQLFCHTGFAAFPIKELYVLWLEDQVMAKDGSQKDPGDVETPPVSGKVKAFLPYRIVIG